MEMGETAIIKPGLTRSCRPGISATAAAVTPCAIRLLRWAFASVLGLWLAGCSSAQLAYGNAQTLTWWWLDRHADFTAEQKPQVQAAIDRWYDWHRRTQIQDLAQLLELAARDAPNEVTATQLCTWIPQFEQRRSRYVEQLVAPVAEIGAQLSPQQLRQVEARLAKTLQDWRRDHLQPDLEERHEAAVSRLLERADTVYGRLDRAQKDFIGEGVRRSAWDPERSLAERQADQRDTLATLKALAQPGLSASQRQELARSSLLRLGQPSSDSQRRYREQLYAAQCRFTAELHNRMTPKQRDHAAERLRSWARDLRGFVPD